MEFKKYPIYKFSFEARKKPEDKFENCNSDKIFKYELSDIEKEDMVEKYKENLKKGGWIEFKSQEVKFLGHDSWVLGWFNHETIDEGQDDNYFLSSFDDYVCRAKRERTYLHGDLYPTLMGAEDYWRWSGVNKDGNRVDPPCRCEHCKSQGVVRINH